MDTFVKYKFSYRELKIDPNETAPFLGYKSALPDDVFAVVEETICETAELFDICGGYKIIDNVSFLSEKRQIIVAGIDFFPQNIVYNQLKHSERIATFVCTAGDDIAQWAKKMMAANEPLKGFIADVLGSVVVERAIAAIQDNLSDEMAQAGLKTTNRYSPGYCGWLTEEQHKLFSLLPHENCGIFLTESALMKPIKSVSGFIGIGKNVRFNPYTCRHCDAASCIYRNKK